jgi:2-phospho-L-lactate guanylyltransferase
MSGMRSGVPSRTEWVVVVPVKRLDRAKTRLSTRPAEQRRSLALAFALDTVRAALGCAAVVGVVVVTDDHDVRAAVAALGASWVPDEPDSGLNAALTHGADVVRLQSPDAWVAVLAADLPALRPEELARALDAATQVSRGFVADATGTGTTLLTAGPGADLDARFGPRSRAAHAASGAVALEPGPVPGLRRDVDTEVDLWDAGRLGLGPATAPLLEGAHGDESQASTT